MLRRPPSSKRTDPLFPSPPLFRPYYYTNPTMIGFTGGGGSTYGGGAEPIIMPVVGDWSPPPAYSQSYYDKSREKASPGYYSVYLDNFRTQVELTATRWTSEIGRAAWRERVYQYV